ncbi:hypothetical protein HQ563_01395 [bacterium]|nr:hypothetical protein [bacterium]
MFDAANDLCDVLMSHQVTDETSVDFGGILCPLCGEVHIRTGEALFPFCYFYSQTKERKYIESAARLIGWLFRTQNEEGSWGREGGDVPKGATVFVTAALCHAYQVAESDLEGEDRGMLDKMIRGGAEYVYRVATPQWAEKGEPGINWFICSSAALQLAYAVTGEEKYRERAKDNAFSGIEQMNEDGFLVGEGTTSLGSGLPSVDVARNLEVGLGALVVYSCLSGNEEVRRAVLRSLETHLNFITPAGYIDDSWGTRVCEWTLLGNVNGGGCQTALMPLRNCDARFQRAAGQNLRYMLKNMMKDGLVATGPHAKDNAEFVSCIKPTASRANTVCQALVYCCGVPLSPTGKSILPTEEKGWVRFYKSVNVIQVRTSALLCTISGYGAGGTVSHVWHSGFGVVQAGSGTIGDEARVWSLNEPPPTGCLTPRIEAEIDGELFSNLFEPRALLSLSGDSVSNDRFWISVRGCLKSASGKDSGLDYIIAYRLEGGIISKEIVVEGPRETSLRSVEPIVFARGCELDVGERSVEIKHPGGTSCILTAPPEHARIGPVSRENSIWHSFPALNAIPIVIEPAENANARRIIYSIELRD